MVSDGNHEKWSRDPVLSPGVCVCGCVCDVCVYVCVCGRVCVMCVCG